MKSRTFALVLVFLIGLAGCGDDDCPTCPPCPTCPTGDGRGTITISHTPRGLSIPWILSGPSGFSHSGSGEARIENIAAGSYTLSWEDIAGWVIPPAETKNLVAEESVTFDGFFVEYDFVYIPPGTFMMGSPEDEPGRYEREGPYHPVTLTKGFYMSKYEVTEELWHQVMGGTSPNPQLPKGGVSWDMAVRFCNLMSIRMGLTPVYGIHGTNGNVTWNQNANGYRLPTEAEWEYVCRAGSTTAFANGPLTGGIYCEPLDPNLDAIGWYCGNRTYGDGPSRVGRKQANAWGLYDMHGNVWEWVWCGGYRQYTSGAVVDPVHNVEPGVERVTRGGSWVSYGARRCRSARRNAFGPDVERSDGGFRLVRTAL